MPRPIERWEQLRKSQAGDGILEIPSLSTGVDSGFGYVRFAIGSQGEPRLLVPCGADVKIKSAPSNSKLLVTVSRLQIDKKTVLFLDVTCVLRSLDSVFAELANEIVYRISTGESPLKAVDSTISDFRALLDNVEHSDVTDQQIVGLIGELTVLLALTKLSPSAIDAWTGPLDQRHDFRNGNDAFEVKTSTRADSSIIHVSSIEQLTEPKGGTLTLIHVKVERSANGQLSVSNLASQIIALGCSQELLSRRLLALGCSSLNSSEWDRARYALEHMDAYRVKEGFPRISSAAFPDERLPAGVRDVTYAVDLLAASDFLFSETEMDPLFRKMTS
ncbi:MULTISPECIES: PD-(D/E)XK motif protein [unclassified Herbaspirillum]|uniref:PD-(D/E)XK motif protein n=1 Tax=unclassified Herbaspirillum TaxID=2624150 RepID=UPI0013143499|nr:MULTISPECIES: PD-(D/E)XK motif protein [unclassified Herbaspirillum]